MVSVDLFLILKIVGIILMNFDIFIEIFFIIVWDLVGKMKIGILGL